MTTTIASRSGTQRNGKRVLIVLPVFCCFVGGFPLSFFLSLSPFLPFSSSPCPSFAAPAESLPPYSYLTGPLEDLRIRGRLPGLNVPVFPYVRQAITRDLVTLDSLSTLDVTRPEMWMHSWLQEGLTDGDTATAVSPGLRALRFHAGMVGGREPAGDTDTDRWITGTITAQLTPRLLAVTTVRVDQRLRDDPAYLGDRFRGMAGYTEQAYLRVTTGPLEATFGRDFLWWGPGRFGQLLLSGLPSPVSLPFSPPSRPLDQIRLQGIVGPVTGVAFAAQLDPIEGSRRYLSGHRLVWRIGDRLTVGGSEVVLYGGPDRPPEWNLLNPFLIYHGESINDASLTGDNNALLGLDIRGRPTAKSEVYGELLIDDFQVEKKTPGDLEPDEVGFLVGGQWADPGGLEGITLGAEYAQVRNRTYNQSNPWNRYLHRNQPLGYRGNDLDDLTIEVRGWLRRTLRGRMIWRQSRQGKGRITDPWTTPWMAYTVEQGYSEPFPTGVVERTRTLLWEVEWHPVRGVFVTGQVSQDWVWNGGHVPGRQEHRTRWALIATLWEEPVVEASSR